MPAKLGSPGMDHDHYPWSPLPNRPVLKWPDNARIAFFVIVNLEYMEWGPPKGTQSGGLMGGLGVRAAPDYERYGHRDYGQRIGIFRILDVLQKHGIKPNIAMDVRTAERFPFLVEHCKKRGCEIVGHGIAANHMISSGMSEQEEKDYIKASLDGLKKAAGVTPVGWLGPQYGESARTPQLLAEAGIRYVCDWVNDEQPFAMKVPQGKLTALPTIYELQDEFALFGRTVPIHRYGELIKESFDTLYDDGAKNGRLLGINLNSWISGQPFRIGHVDKALGHIMSRQGVWAASCTEITDWFERNPPKVRGGSP